jgi:hypothetical protein
VIALRILIGALVAAAIGVAMVPLWVLLDIRRGGTGWGLCPTGIGACRNSYFSGFELLAYLAVALFCVRVLRLVERHRGIRV